MGHLLVNPKYKELWGKSFMKELGRLSQGLPGVSKGTDTIVLSAVRAFHTTTNGTSCTYESV